MGKLRVEGFTLSLDGFGAGLAQGPEDPMGIRGGTLHGWFRGTRTFRAMIGQESGTTTGPDADFASRGFRNIGAEIMGRNMFGPVRGPWPNMDWKGWWGPNPPFHCDVFVLTQYAREPLAMEGGTTFHFVTGGIHEALARAQDSAGDRDIRLGGGVSTVRQYLKAGLVDEMHLAISPVLLGGGEHLMRDIDLPALGFRVTEQVASDTALHVVLTRAPADGN